MLSKCIMSKRRGKGMLFFRKKNRDLCLKVLSGNENPDERKKFEEWLNSSDENKTLFEKLLQAWNISPEANPNDFPDVENEWKILYNRLDLDNIDKQLYKVKKVPGETKLLSSKTLRPVLTGVFSLVIVVFVLLFYSESNQTEVWKEVTASDKEILKIQLSEGSTIILNKKSKVKFPAEFDENKREIKLFGEAFFSVKKDKKRPFIVFTSNAKTTVLGTKFNVNGHEEKTEVIVKEGLVNLSPLSEESEGINIKENEISIITKDNKISLPGKINADYRLGWVEGKLIFDNTSLANAIPQIEKFYGVKISADQGEYLNAGFTGTFKKQKIDDVLDIICLAYELDYIKEGDSYKITRK
ncbi:MAG: FecR family protein [Ignavibacteria bacterium]|nr:FecR family protein [Ignavibacteria bacterium]